MIYEVLFTIPYQISTEYTQQILSLFSVLTKAEIWLT